MTIDIEKLNLGESSDLIHADTYEAISAHLIALTQQCQRHLDIFTHTLDRRIYNNEALYEAILKLATRSRYSQIRIIIKDSTDLVRRGSRLMNLSQRISSRMQFRNPPTEYRDYVEEFIVADNIGLIHRPIASRYDAHICFNEPSKARQFNKFFEECWLKSSRDPNLRRLDI